jgi:leader peptidase (prepilin peptidase)/N-methyltransferase
VIVALAAALGALLGAFAPTVAYRMSVPYGEPRRTVCDRCGTAVGLWRCAGCRQRLGPRGWVTAATGATVFGTLAWALGTVPALPAFLAVAALGIVLAAIDLACHRLPDPLVALGFLVAVPVLLLAGPTGALIRAGIGAVALFVGYLLLALVPRSGLGFGDVKLAGLLGLLLGWVGWPAIVLGATLPHLLNGPVVLVLLATGKVRRDDSVPLGPALLAGAWLAVVLVAGWTNRYRG